MPHLRAVCPILLALILLPLSAVPLVADDAGAGVRYVGGTVSIIPADADGHLRTTDDLFLEFRCPRREVSVGYQHINLLEYGQNVNRRLLLAATLSPLFLLSKSRQHFLTVGYTDREGKQQAMVFRVEKSKIRSVLVALEARTGLKVTYQDDQARRAGKG